MKFYSLSPIRELDVIALNMRESTITIQNPDGTTRDVLVSNVLIDIE